MLYIIKIQTVILYLLGNNFLKAKQGADQHA